MRKCGKNVLIRWYKCVDERTQFLYRLGALGRFYSTYPRLTDYFHMLYTAGLTWFSTARPHQHNSGGGTGCAGYSHPLLLRLLFI